MQVGMQHNERCSQHVACRLCGQEHVGTKVRLGAEAARRSWAHASRQQLRLTAGSCQNPAAGVLERHTVQPAAPQPSSTALLTWSRCKRGRCGISACS